MFNKLQGVHANLEPQDTETIADALCEIGKGLQAKKDYLASLKWLDRAHDLLNNSKPDLLTREATELRYVIMQSLVNVCLELQTSDSLKRARSLVDYIRADVGDRLFVLLLELELLDRLPAETFDSNAFANVIRRMIKAFDPTESYFKITLHHIRKLHDKSPAVSCCVLDKFMSSLQRYEVAEHTVDWNDRLVVTRIWMATSQRDSAEAIRELEKTLSKIPVPLKPDAAIAAHLVSTKTHIASKPLLTKL
jgi:hypothetical protein